MLQFWRVKHCQNSCFQGCKTVGIILGRILGTGILRKAQIITSYLTRKNIYFVLSIYKQICIIPCFGSISVQEPFSFLVFIWKGILFLAILSSTSYNEYRIFVQTPTFNWGAYNENILFFMIIRALKQLHSKSQYIMNQTWTQYSWFLT